VDEWPKPLKNSGFGHIDMIAAYPKDLNSRRRPTS